VAMLRALRAVLQGPEKPEFSRVADLGYWRRLPFVLLLSAMVLFGIAPGILTSRIEPAAKAVVAAHLTPSQAGQAPAVPAAHAAPAASAPGHSGH